MLVAPVENSWFSGGESPLSLNLLKVFRGRFQVKLLSKYPAKLQYAINAR
mgnify:FL=1